MDDGVKYITNAFKNVAIIKAYVPHKSSKVYPPILRKVELNVSQKKRNQVEKLLIQYIGEETH